MTCLSFFYLLIHKIEVLNSNNLQYCGFVFCGLCLWCFAKNTTHQCEAIFLSSRFNSWKLHIFLQLSVVLVFGAFTSNSLEVSPPCYHIFEQVSSLSLFSHWQEKSKTRVPIYPQISSTTAMHFLYKEIQSLSSFISYIFHCYPALVACCALTQKPSLCK